MKQSSTFHQMQKLKLKIPIPSNLAINSSPHVSSTQLSLSVKSDSIINEKAKPQYTDEEVYAQINHVCNLGDIKANTLGPENEFNGKKPNAVGSRNEFNNKNSNTNEFDSKVNKLMKYLNSYSNSNFNSNFLPLNFVKNSNVLSPYEELTKTNNQQREKSLKNSNSGSNFNTVINTSERTRLSVSKIIPFSYCELKNMYQLYMGDSNIENQSMIIGKRIHHELEIKSHPQINVKLENNDGIEKIISIDKLIELQNPNLDLKSLKGHYTSLNILNEQLKNEQYRQQITLQMRLKQLQTIENQKQLDIDNKLKLINIQERLKFLKENYGILDTENDNIIDTNIVISENDDILKPKRLLLSSALDKTEMRSNLTDIKMETSNTSVQSRLVTNETKSIISVLPSEPRTNLEFETETKVETEVETKVELGAEAAKVASKLESPIDEEIESFIPLIKLTSTIDPTSTIAYKLSQTITRTLKLLEFGECREVLVHGFYDPNESEIVTESYKLINNFDSNILISGIIDELRVSSLEDDAFSEYKKELKLKLKDIHDFDKIFQVIKELSEKWTPMLYLIINDDKTRKSTKLPSLDQQKSHLLQVGIYKYLINLLTNDTKFSYISWCKNLQNRGELSDDISQNELSNDLITSICMFNINFLSDFLSLKNGISINSIDEIDPKLNKITNSYEFKNNSNNPNLNFLNGRWLIKPTLNHLLIRLSQVQNLLKPFLSDDNLQITYIYQNSNKELRKINQTYDEAYVKSQIDLGLELWLGKREPYPTNNETTCKYCEFNNKCQIPSKRRGLL